MHCTVYRCSKQDEMYLYVRDSLTPESLPEPLRKLTGRLTQVMQLELGTRKLARVDVDKVMEKIAADGYYLQMPPNGVIKAYTYEGD